MSLKNRSRQWPRPIASSPSPEGPRPHLDFDLLCQPFLLKAHYVVA